MAPKVRSPRFLVGVPFEQWSEEEFVGWITRHAKRAGWRVTRFRKAVINGRWITPTSTPFVDLVLVRPPRILMLEVKRERGWHWEDGQEELMLSLQACPGVEAAMVRPSDSRRLLFVLARSRREGAPGGNVQLSLTPATGGTNDG